MIASKTLYSKSFKEYQLTEEQLKNLQNILLNMFLDIKKICDIHNIKYIMGGGSLLGTIRHKGFIPWDDDIDIMLLREEYNKLKDVFEKNLSEKYILAEPLSGNHYYSKMPKIYKKGTTYVEIPFAGIQSYNMVFIDVFIIEQIPKSAIIRKIKSNLYDFSYKASSVCLDYLYPSPAILDKCKYDDEVLQYYKFRRRLGFIFSKLGGINFYLWICEKLANSNSESEYLGVPAGISYEREILKKEVYLELTTGKFCGYDVNIPLHYDIYLKNLYGDYMKIPPIEKRENHMAYKVKL